MAGRGSRGCLFAGIVFPPSEEFYCVVGIDDDFAAVLGDGVGDDGVFVVLGGGVGAAEEFFDAFDAIDVAFEGCAVGGGGCASGGGLEDFCHKGAELADVHCSDGHIFIYSDHNCEILYRQSKGESMGVHTTRTTGGGGVVALMPVMRKLLCVREMLVSVADCVVEVFFFAELVGDFGEGVGGEGFALG